MYNSTEVCRCSYLTTVNTGIIKYILHLSTHVIWCPLAFQLQYTEFAILQATQDVAFASALHTDVRTLCPLYPVTVSFHRALSCIYSQV